MPFCSNENRHRLHARQHGLPGAVPCGHILAARAICRMVRFAFQIPPAVFGGGGIGQHIDLPVHRADHAFFGHQTHRGRRQRIADADKFGNRVQALMLDKTMPAGEAIGGKAEFEAFVGILHMAREKLGRAAPRVACIGGRGEVRSFQPLIIQMARSPVHEYESAGKSNPIRAADFRFDERGILAPSQHRCSHLYIARQRSDKSNLRRLQWRHIVVCQLCRLIGESRAQAAISSPSLVPTRRNGQCVNGRARLKLGKD